LHPLGHMAVACGIVWAGAHAIERVRSSNGLSPPSPARIADAIDYRLVMIGALLPDLVDKPIGRVFFRSQFDGNGHLIGHTLLFALVILLPGLYLMARLRDPRVLAIGLADLTHLLVDPINHAPQTFFWPLLGTDFPHVTFLGPRLTVLEESVAAALFAGVGYLLYKQNRIEQFMQSGRL